MTDNTSDNASTNQERPVHQDATDQVLRSVRVWNELLTASTDMAFDVVLKNWNYSRSIRGSAEQAIEDTLKTQQQLNKEMLQAWQGYTSNVQEIVEKNRK